MKRIISLLLLAGLTACTDDLVEPQITLSITGRVLDQESRTPVTQARLTVLSTSDYTDTDSLGRFEFQGIPFQENISFRIVAAGYQDAMQSVSFDPLGAVEKETEILLRPDLADHPLPSAFRPVAPADKAGDVPVSTRLTWSVLPGKPEDELQFALYLYGPDDPEGRLLASGLSDTTYWLEDLDYGAPYFWQVVVEDQVHEPLFGPVWSFTTRPFPDYRIHFVRQDPETGNLVIFAAEAPPGPDWEKDSLGEYRLTDPSLSSFRPRLQPLKREKVAFLAYGADQKLQLFTMNRNGSGKKALTSSVPVHGGDDPAAVDFAWSPRGDYLLYPSGNALFRIDVGGQHYPSRFNLTPPQAGYFFVEVHWSESGLIAARQRSFDPASGSRIILYNEKGEVVRTLLDETNSNGQVRSPSLTHDGKRMLFVQDQKDRPSLNGLPRDAILCRMDNLLGPDSTRLVVELDEEGKWPDTNDLQPCLSPGEDLIIFNNRAIGRSGLGDIYLTELEPDDRAERQLLFRNAAMPDWR